MSKEILVDISGAGAMHGLHFEEFSLTSFGNAQIKRATDIKWNERSQRWDIHLLDHNENVVPHHPEHLAGFCSYEDARAHEVRYLQGCRLKGFSTVSAAGDELGNTLRAAG
jgi:hypothetical protein